MLHAANACNARAVHCKLPRRSQTSIYSSVCLIRRPECVEVQMRTSLASTYADVCLFLACSRMQNPRATMRPHLQLLLPLAAGIFLHQSLKMASSGPAGKAGWFGGLFSVCISSECLQVASKAVQCQQVLNKSIEPVCTELCSVAGHLHCH